MWNPGFEFVERPQALVYGYRRSLCVRSWVHRGTQDKSRPRARVSTAAVPAAASPSASRPDQRAEVIGYLRARELVTNVYLERHVAAACRWPPRRRRSPISSIAHMCNMPARSIPRDAAARRRHGPTGQSGPNDAYRLQHAGASEGDGHPRSLARKQVVDEVERACGRHGLSSGRRQALRPCCSSASRVDGGRRQRQVRIAARRCRPAVRRSPVPSPRSDARKMRPGPCPAGSPAGCGP